MKNTIGVNQTLQKENNLSLVIRLIRKNRGCTRVWLAQNTGLTAASIGKLVGELIEWGLVLETDIINNDADVGRRPIGLEINCSRYNAIAVRINHDDADIAIYDFSGKRLCYKLCNLSRSDNPQLSMRLIVCDIVGLIDKSGIKPICVGVSIPGPFNYRTGRVPSTSDSAGWENVDIKKELEDVLSIPTFVEHDAKCGALAEIRYGSYPENSNIFFVTADKGIGAGIIINGDIYHGASGYSGEFGHTSINMFGPKCECGNRGCLELYSSVNSIRNNYVLQKYSLLQYPEEDVSEEDIFRLIRDGDPIACSVYTKAISHLAFGLVGAINMFNPEYVVVTGLLTEGGDLFMSTLMSTLKQYLMPEQFEILKVKTSSFYDDPTLLGASVMAFDNMLNSPSIYFKI